MSTESDPHQSVLPSQSKIISAWFDPRHRSMGMLAFALNRVTAIGLVFYLTLHLVVLSLLALGESTWDAFIAIVRSPFFLVLDIMLIAGVLIHGLNGIRLSLVGLGLFSNHQKGLFGVLMVITLVVLVLVGFGVFNI